MKTFLELPSELRLSERKAVRLMNIGRENIYEIIENPPGVNPLFQHVSVTSFDEPVDGKVKANYKIYEYELEQCKKIISSEINTAREIILSQGHEIDFGSILLQSSEGEIKEAGVKIVSTGPEDRVSLLSVMVAAGANIAKGLLNAKCYIRCKDNSIVLLNAEEAQDSLLDLHNTMSNVVGMTWVLKDAISEAGSIADIITLIDESDITTISTILA